MAYIASARPNECLKQENVDFVVIGEPELTVLELANTLANEKEAEAFTKLKASALSKMAK